MFTESRTRESAVHSAGKFRASPSGDLISVKIPRLDTHIPPKHTEGMENEYYITFGGEQEIMQNGSSEVT